MKMVFFFWGGGAGAANFSPKSKAFGDFLESFFEIVISKDCLGGI